jgi:hypothetical protein
MRDGSPTSSHSWKPPSRFTPLLLPLRLNFFLEDLATLVLGSSSNEYGLLYQAYVTHRVNSNVSRSYTKIPFLGLPVAGPVTFRVVNFPCSPVTA